MPFSSGTYTLPTSVNPVVSGTTITTNWATTTLNDIATALSTCVLKDGSQATCSASVPFTQGVSAGTTAQFAIDNTGALTGTTNTTSSTGYQLKSAQMQMFMFQIINTAGTLQHRIGSDAAFVALATWSNKITAASVALQNTPNGNDATTAFVTGLKISSADTTRLYFDVPDQVTLADVYIQSAVAFNDSGTAYVLRPSFTSLNINGVTRTRLNLRLVNASSGASTAWSTATFSAGTSIIGQCMGILL